MQLLLVRHGLPVRIDEGAGPADPGLSSEGVAQAAALARWATGDPSGPIEALWSSPMRRARETAGPLAEAFGGLPVEVHDGLKEFDHALNFYVPMEELRTSGDPRWEVIKNEWTSAENREERSAFRTTVVAVVEGIVAAHPSQQVAVVCHGGVINAYLSHLLGIEQTLFFEPVYTSVSRVIASRTGARQLVSLNEIAHLRPPPEPM